MTTAALATVCCWGTALAMWRWIISYAGSFLLIFGALLMAATLWWRWVRRPERDDR